MFIFRIRGETLIYHNIFLFLSINVLFIVMDLVSDMQLEKYEIARDVILSGLQVDPFR
jgi:hypothetical protein